jgi:hypothetical protein
MPFGLNRRTLYTFFSAAVILTGTLIAIQYANGYFRFTKRGVITDSGLLNANSFPSGAQVLVNGRLMTATEDTIYLEPGQYSVQIAKDGYSPWQKELTIERGLVAQTNAQLFRVAPSLTPLSFTGVNQLQPSPDGQKIVYYTASASAQAKKGLYILDLSSNPLNLQRGARQIADEVEGISLAKADFIWSPDSSQILVITPEKEVILEIGQKNDLRTLTDVSFQRKKILSEWEAEMYQRERQFLREFPPEVIAVATQSAKNVYLSPDKKRLLYTATQSAVIPENIVPPVPAANSQPESRTLEPGAMYVYDREEDRNFKIASGNTDGVITTDKHLLARDLFQREALSLTSSPSAFLTLQATTSAETVKRFMAYHTPLYTQAFQWFPDSKHLIYVEGERIRIMEYDGTNDVVVYSGPFRPGFVYPWPDGGQMVIITSFSQNSPENFYAIELK